MRCIYCRRRRPPCGFYPVAFLRGPDGSGQLCWDCDRWLRAGRPERLVPTEEATVAALFMRCCGRYEEDETQVNWRTLREGGYLHWGPCLQFGQRSPRC